MQTGSTRKKEEFELKDLKEDSSSSDYDSEEDEFFEPVNDEKADTHKNDQPINKDNNIERDQQEIEDDGEQYFDAEDGDEEKNEDDSLLDSHEPSQPQQQSWLSWIGHGIYSYTIEPVRTLLTYVKEHPIITTLAIANALTTVVNSLLYAIEKKPEELSLQAWEETSSERKWLAGILMACSFLVNVVLAALFLPKTRVLFQADTWRNHFLKSLFSLLLGGAAAFSIGTLTYQTFGFTIVGALSMAGLSLPINFATRSVASGIGQKRIYNKFINSEAKSQTKFINLLKRIQKKYIPDLNNHLINVASQYSNDKPEEFYEALLIELKDKLNDLHKKHPDLFVTKKITGECCGTYSGLAFDIALATVISTTAYLIFTQKGYNGIEITDKWIYGQNSTHIEDLSPELKILIGSPSGAGSGFLYLFSALDIRTVLVALGSQLLQEPKKIPFASILVVACVLSGAAMLNVSNGVLNNTKGLFIHFIEKFPNLFLFGGTAGGIVVNAKSAILQAYPEQLELTNVTVKNLINHFADANEHPLTPETIKNLRQNSLFAPAKAPTSANNQDVDIELATTNTTKSTNGYVSLPLRNGSVV